MYAEIRDQTGQNIETITELAREQGLYLQIGSDFTVFKKVRDAQVGRSSLSPMFDPTRCRIEPADGFWIIGTDNLGRVVHTQAMLLNQMGQQTLGQFLYTNRVIYAPPGEEVNLETTIYNRAPCTRRIKGRVAYHGELWLSEEFRGNRNTTILPRLALGLALRQWSPDFVFGLMNPLLCCKGLSAREGYMHVEPGGILWDQAGKDEPLEEWIVWMARDDLEYLMEFSPEPLYRKLEQKKRTLQAVPIAQAA
jgi:hypothetical protein